MTGPTDAVPRVGSTRIDPARPPGPRPSALDQPSFREVLEGEVRVSRHARARMNREGIRLDPGQNRRLRGAVDRLAQRGGATSLVVLDDMAVVVNVQKRTLVTVISGDRRGDGVFTDIDSAVIAE
ncbi:MAG: hypothetical protein R6U70_09685 [Bacillota bacterium]